MKDVLKEASVLLSGYQTTLGASREQCDDWGKLVWDRIERVLAGIEKMVSVPKGKRERMRFYEEAMKDPKNHGGLALELAYLRGLADSVECADGASRAAIFVSDDGSDEVRVKLTFGDGEDGGSNPKSAAHRTAIDMMRSLNSEAYTDEEIASACLSVEIPDSLCERLLVALDVARA